MVDGPLIQRHQPPLGPGVAQRFAWSREVTDMQVAEAHAFRTRFRAHMLALLGHDGVLLMPPCVYRGGITDDGAFRFYASVIDAIARPDLRLYLYHFPDICGVPITLSTLTGRKEIGRKDKTPPKVETKKP